jgi:acyl carrier protein
MIRALLDKIDISGRRQHERVFAGRLSLSPEEFYEKYFCDRGFSKDLVLRIKHIFDKNIGFDLSRLSAKDDFSKELKYIWDHDSMADVETIVALEKEFGIRISDDEGAMMKTFDCVVRVIHAKVQNDKSPNGKVITSSEASQAGAGSAKL